MRYAFLILASHGLMAVELNLYTKQEVTDAAGNTFVAGFPGGCTLPLKSARQQACGPVYLAKLDRNGELIFGTYEGNFGGALFLNKLFLLLDPLGRPVLARQEAPVWPLPAIPKPYQWTVARYSSDGASRHFSTAIVGSVSDDLIALAFDAGGAIHALVETRDPEFTVEGAAPAFPPVAAPDAPFAALVKLERDGAIVRSGYLFTGNAASLALAADGVVYVQQRRSGEALIVREFDAAWRQTRLVESPEDWGVTLLPGPGRRGFRIGGQSWQQPFPRRLYRRPSYWRWEAGALVPTTAEPFAYAIDSLTVSPADGNAVLAASREGVFLSPDNGWTWQRQSAQRFTQLVFASAGELYGVQAGQLFRSLDLGQTWSDVPEACPGITVLAPSPGLDGSLYAVARGGFCQWREGRWWLSAVAANNISLLLIGFDLSSPNTITLSGPTDIVLGRFGIIGGEGMLRSDDGGRTFSNADSTRRPAGLWQYSTRGWTRRELVPWSSGPFQRVLPAAYVTFDPARPELLTGVNSSSRMILSSDGGLTWRDGPGVPGAGPMLVSAGGVAHFGSTSNYLLTVAAWDGDWTWRQTISTGDLGCVGPVRVSHTPGDGAAVECNLQALPGKNLTYLPAEPFRFATNARGDVLP